jgi:hypothetical protein
LPLAFILGVAVLSGMLGVTIFGIFFTLIFYVVVRRFTEQPAADTADIVEDSNHERHSQDVASS